MKNEITQIESILKHLKNDQEMSPRTAFRTNAKIRILNTVTNGTIPSHVVYRHSTWLLYVFRFALVLIFLFGSTVYAAQSSNPKDILYPVKTMSEQVALTLSPTESAKTSVAMTIISRRASEHASAEKEGNTEEINETSTNFESAVSEIRSTKRVNHEKVEEEIRKHEDSSQKESDQKEKIGDSPSGQTEQKEQSFSSPTPTIKESSHQDDSILDIKGSIELD